MADDTCFHPLRWRKRQKSSGFVSVTSFLGLLLEICSQGCYSSRSILERQVYLYRLGKAINGELVEVYISDGLPVISV